MPDLNLTDVEREFQAHADTNREESVSYLRNAIDALKHGEDENAISHILDAVRYMGRHEAFLDVAKDVCEFIGDPDERE